MPTILDYYEYAKLATGAYVNMDAFSNFDGTDFANQSNADNRLPQSIANQMFDESSEEAGGNSVWRNQKGQCRLIFHYELR